MAPPTLVQSRIRNLQFLTRSGRAHHLSCRAQRGQRVPKSYEHLKFASASTTLNRSLHFREDLRNAIRIDPPDVAQQLAPVEVKPVHYLAGVEPSP